jgi:diketogulonate reductase-like aldo/keto reductase
MGYATVRPAINQIETHVFFQQHEAHDFLKRSDIQMQGWSPFAAGRNNIFENPVLAEYWQQARQEHCPGMLKVALPERDHCHPTIFPEKTYDREHRHFRFCA